MSTLIKLYGEYWNPDIIDWGSTGRGNSGKLLGTIAVNGRKKECDFWDARGVYVLHENFKAIYVGKAFRTSIGSRVKDHLTDRLAGRWDMFTWYSTSSYRKTHNDLKKAGQRILNPETIVKSLEAIAILIADPTLNRKRESLPDAMEVTQVIAPRSRTIRNYLQDILDRLPEN